jgi:methylmalonyl-CoA mutase N-terminal domain/subunit
MMLRFHTQTSGVTLTAQQPENNVIRVAIQALAAILGGTQSLHTNCKDEAWALPTEEGVRLALRTQQVGAYETGIINTVDPLGGSYCIEALTDKLEAEAEEYIGTIDDLGGMVAAIEQGYVQRQIEQAAYDYGRAVDTGARLLVGVNTLQEAHEREPDVFVLSEETEQKQLKAIRRLKSGRDQAAVRRALSNIEQVARTEENLMPAIIESVRVAATVGEICQRLQTVFGEYEPTVG